MRTRLGIVLSIAISLVGHGGTQKNTDLAPLQVTFAGKNRALLCEASGVSLNRKVRRENAKVRRETPFANFAPPLRSLRLKEI